MPELVRKHALEVFVRKSQDAVRDDDGAVTHGIGVDVVRLFVVELDFCADARRDRACRGVDFVKDAEKPFRLRVASKRLRIFFETDVRFAERREGQQRERHTDSHADEAVADPLRRVRGRYQAGRGEDEEHDDQIEHKIDAAPYLARREERLQKTQDIHVFLPAVPSERAPLI